MWPHSYYPAAQFAPNYFPPAGVAPTPTPSANSGFPRPTILTFLSTGSARDEWERAKRKRRRRDEEAAAQR